MTDKKMSRKSEVKGRNGYFAPDSLWYGIIPANKGCPIFLDLYSKKAGKSPPTRMLLALEDAVIIRDALSEMIKEAECATP